MKYFGFIILTLRMFFGPRIKNKDLPFSLHTDEEEYVHSYAKVDLLDTVHMIGNFTTVELTPLRTCQDLQSCQECQKSHSDIDYPCFWCPSLEKCTSGFDRITSQRF